MSVGLHIFFIVVSVFFNVIIVAMLKKGRLDLKYSLLWIFAGLALLVISIFPDVLYALSALMGIHSPMNALMFFAIIFLLMMVILLTTVVSALRSKLIRLCQVVSILEKRISDMEEGDK